MAFSEHHFCLFGVLLPLDKLAPVPLNDRLLLLLPCCSSFTTVILDGILWTALYRFCITLTGGSLQRIRGFCGFVPSVGYLCRIFWLRTSYCVFRFASLRNLFASQSFFNHNQHELALSELFASTDTLAVEVCFDPLEQVLRYLEGRRFAFSHVLSSISVLIVLSKNVCDVLVQFFPVRAFFSLTLSCKAAGICAHRLRVSFIWLASLPSFSTSQVYLKVVYKAIINITKI